MTTSPDQPQERGGVPGELARIREQVGDLVQTLWAARPGAELMDTVTEIETLKASLDALELAVVRELDHSGAVKEAGWASTQDFLTHTSGGHKGTGPAMVRLAHATSEPLMTPVAAAHAAGQLSTAKAQVIERGVDALPSSPGLRSRGVEVLLTESKALDATDLRRLTRRLLTIVDPDGDERRDERALAREERAAHYSRHLTVTPDQAGGAWIKGRCSAEDAAQIKATLIPLSAPQPSADGQRDPRDHGVRLLDALVEGCRRLQTADLLPETHGAAPRLTVTMQLEDLHRITGFATTETGEELSASAARRLACDADLIPAVLGGPSEVLDVARQMRLASAAIWKALVARDHHCRFPHCTRPAVMCHAHHLVHWADGGATCLGNLILLCGHHHRLVHAGPWHIEQTEPGQFEFHPPSRATVADVPRPPPRE